MQNKKGFTLLELIVAMAIIAVLMGLSLFGIQSVQRSQRDTERRAAVSNVNLEVAAYYGDNGVYPSVSFDIASGTAKIGTKSVVLKGSAKLAPAGATTSDLNGTVYCYVKYNSSYQLGVYLEGTASWGSTGTSQQLGNGGICDTRTYWINCIQFLSHIYFLYNF